MPFSALQSDRPYSEDISGIENASPLEGRRCELALFCCPVSETGKARWVDGQRDGSGVERAPLYWWLQTTLYLMQLLRAATASCLAAAVEIRRTMRSMDDDGKFPV